MASLVEAKRDGRLSEREAASITRHLATCASCAALDADLEHLGALLRVPPRTLLEKQRARLALLREAARPRRAPSSSSRLMSLALALVLVPGTLWIALRRAPERPPVVARLPNIPRSHALSIDARPVHTAPRARTETTIVPDGPAVFTRTAAGDVETVALHDGTIALSVRPLRGAERFIVRTEDAEVEVRGTIFHVEAQAARLRSVRVTEGKVEVRFHGATWLVAAGERWSRPSTAEPVRAPVSTVLTRPAADPTPAPASTALARPTAEPAQAPASTASASATPPASARPDSMDALREGIRMVDRGDYDAAAQRLSAFGEAHPNDERAEDALFLLMVSLQRGGRMAEARTAARRYLTQYPKGYRRSEAEALLAAPNPR
ncbi:Hypothetical protein A7982_08359 [Minicystis rosea]|nr:Hypothetical protein A7982_08359 [Minicystis rosea]